MSAPSDSGGIAPARPALDLAEVEGALGATSALVTASMHDDFDSFNAILAELGPGDVERRVIGELVGIVLNLGWWIDQLRPGLRAELVQQHALSRHQGREVQP